MRRSDSVGQPGTVQRPGGHVEDGYPFRQVDAQTYLTLVSVANALGELVARANAEQRYPAEREAGAVYDQVRQAGRGDPGGDRHGHGTGPAAPVIAVIRKGSDFGHAAQYLFRPGDGGPSTSNGG